MLTKLFSGTIFGLDGYLVEVEVSLNRGLPGVIIVGLPDEGCRECPERVKSALLNSNFEFPLGKITVNLAPAFFKKAGAHFDLAIALGILIVSGQLKIKDIEDYIFLGELALSGNLRPVKGVLPILLSAFQKGKKIAVLPFENCREATLVNGIKIFQASHLIEVVEFLKEGSFKKFFSSEKIEVEKSENQINFSEIKGQVLAKRALEISAAGGHNLLMVGPPGTGKTMLARAFPSILPPLSQEESLEVTKIYSIAGFLNENKFLISSPPFRAPHHTTSTAGLVGGGNVPRPGEVTLAHRGILFLDELPEFNRSALEVLRQPLEDGFVTISRAKFSFVYPSKFLLIGALNPCPCGFLGDGSNRCRCTIGAIQKYWGKISGPLLDRIDLQIEVPRLKTEEIFLNSRTDSAYSSESSEQIKQRVVRVRGIQKNRYGREVLNAQLKGKEVKKFIQLDEGAEKILEQAASKFFLSYRSIEKILKVSRTIADLEESKKILTPHLAEALNYRLIKNYF